MRRRTPDDLDAALVLAEYQQLKAEQLARIGTRDNLLYATLIEHQPQQAMAHLHPADYTRLSQEPGFIAFRLRKTPALSLTCEDAL